MSRFWRIFLSLTAVFSLTLSAQEAHDHGVPEKLGAVSFPISCIPAVQQRFNRGVALLHSFAYSAAENTCRDVAARDPRRQWINHTRNRNGRPICSSRYIAFIRNTGESLTISSTYMTMRN
jgi:hypothetical protein